MYISSVPGSVGAQSASSSVQRGDLLDRDVFLELLIIQMQNQDPLDPMSNEEFIGQLSQLAGVEQLRTVNSNLEIIQMYQSSLNAAQSVGLIGKQVKALGDSVMLPAEGNCQLSFRLSSDANEVSVSVMNAEGKVVRVIEAGSMKAGNNSVVWDGTDSEGNRLPTCEYTFEVNAKNEGGAVAVDTFITGVVMGIVFEDGVPKLLVGNQRVPLGDVYEVQTVGEGS